jgi:flavoprotein
MVFGISDTLVTNIYAQAGKCRIPSIVFACDVAPEMDTEAPGGMVKVYPRPIDLENTRRLAELQYTQVVTDLAALTQALAPYLQDG